MALVADQRAVGLVVEGHLGDAEHDQRVEDPGEHGEEEQAAEGSEVLPDEARKTIHVGQPPNPGMFKMMRSMSLIPMNGMIRPPTP